MAGKKSRITDLKDTLFKSVEQNNRFKNAPKRVTKKKICKEEILKKFFIEE
jgi:hypothetical protein